MFLIVGLGNPGKRYDNNRHNIGYKVIDAIKANITPNAVAVPNSLNGGESAKFIAKNPIAVVRLVINKASIFLVRLSFIAENLSMPSLSRLK